MAYNIHRQLKQNIRAIQIALDWKEGQILSNEELDVLRSYAGFGGIKAILYPPTTKEEWIELDASKEDLKLFDDVMHLHQLIHEKVPEDYDAIIHSLKNSVLTAFYTPDIVPQTIYTVLKEKGIEPKTVYEPSAGAGVFITEAVNAFPSIQQITAVEKDVLTGTILKALSSSFPVKTDVQIKGFEETSIDENGKYDLIISNIPFGNFRVRDDEIVDPKLSGKIHNLFFVKAMQKIGDGGLLAFITTDAFLNSPSNEYARGYLFVQAHFVSLSVMPDNLMKETGNTEAPNHLLIVQKNKNKEEWSEEEKLLVQTVERENEFGNYAVNAYINAHEEIIAANEIKSGTNQYGKAHLAIWQNGDINSISEKLSAILREGFDQRFSKIRFEYLQSSLQERQGKQFTFLPLPESKQSNEGMQLGLFQSIPAESSNRALAYINEGDCKVIQKQTARIVSILKTTEKPDHETFVLITGKWQDHNRYLYKLYSNVADIKFPNGWMTGIGIANYIDDLSQKLKDYPYEFRYEGDQSFEEAFGVNKKNDPFTDIKPYYKKGTLIIHKGEAGIIENVDTKNGRADFELFTSSSKNVSFYQRYIKVRDAYFELSHSENSGILHEGLRNQLNRFYEEFFKQYGALNESTNRKHILNDALGFVTLSSVETKVRKGSVGEGEEFIRSDIFYGPLFQKKESFTTDDPVEALARCLNEKGKVDIGYISKATGNTNEETIKALEQHIYVNPEAERWETADQFLSGNVVAKLELTRREAERNPGDVQIKRSLDALEKIQPERIPFELLDFNLGERWMPMDYYNRFATHLFEEETEVNYFNSIDAFKVITDKGGAKVYQEYAVTPKNGKTVYGNTLLEHALENTSPFFTYEVELNGKSVRIPDNEATQLAHQKIESIRAQYIEWQISYLMKTRSKSNSYTMISITVMSFVNTMVRI